MTDELTARCAASWGKVRQTCGFLVALCLAAAIFLIVKRKQNDAELEAKEELTRIGAIVVMDGQQEHVSSVNLSTLQNDDLARAVAHLPPLRRLVSLDASRTRFDDTHAETLQKLSNLRSLTLNNTVLTNKGMESIGVLRQLESLHVANTNVSDAGLVHLAS